MRRYICALLFTISHRLVVDKDKNKKGALAQQSFGWSRPTIYRVTCELVNFAVMSKIRRSTQLVMMASSVSLAQFITTAHGSLSEQKKDSAQGYGHFEFD